MNKTTFYITSWDPLGAKVTSLKKELVKQGVAKERIKVLSDRTSRPGVLNRAIRECTTKYIGFLEDDVVPAHNAVKILENLLDNYPNAGLAIAPVQQWNEEEIIRATPRVAENTPDRHCLQDMSNQMWTLNFVIFRKSTGVFFDEDFFGNQIFDWDFGLQLMNKGFLSLGDHRTAVAHTQTNYGKKSLAYHAVVCRNRQIFMSKWKDINKWLCVNVYNLANPNTIPTIEELTHTSEQWIMDYISQYDHYGLVDCWYKSRFENIHKIASYCADFEHDFIGCNKQIYNPIIENEQSFPKFK